MKKNIEKINYMYYNKGAFCRFDFKYAEKGNIFRILLFLSKMFFFILCMTICF